MNLKKYIRDVKDFPKKGIIFRDISPLLHNGSPMSEAIEELEKHCLDADVIVGPDARGFIFGTPISSRLKKPFVMVRKPGKLPRATYSQDYQLEYGQDTLEIHQDALSKEDKVLIVDDLLATGGTIAATTKLVRQLGAQATAAAFVISLPDLGGEKVLADAGLDVYSLLQFEGE